MLTDSEHILPSTTSMAHLRKIRPGLSLQKHMSKLPALQPNSSNLIANDLSMYFNSIDPGEQEKAFMTMLR